VQRIRQDPEIGATPVIVFGGESPHAEVERLRQAGARVYRTRPLDLREFIALLDGVLGAGAPSTNPTPPLPARTAGQG
jgi:CheY-like chemotaxis protein